MIKEWLDTYKPANRDEAAQALREIMQEVALAGLYRANFFEIAAFYGGTALRIFYGLDRFSEDLDFSLLDENDGFSFQPYMDAIIAEFNALGMDVSIREKEKTAISNVESAFLKSETEWKELVLEGIIPEQGLKQVANVKIKIEVDKRPPQGFDTEEKLLTKPFSFYVKCFTPPDLFAGKLHALLFRKWIERVKGRDWYDLEWYVKKGVPLNLRHLVQRAKDSGDWGKDTMTETEFRDLLHQKINTVKMDRVREDIRRFIPNPAVLEIWSAPYFHDLAEKIRIKEQRHHIKKARG